MLLLLGIILLKHDANINVKSNNGCTALILASQDGYKEIVALLLKHGADVNAKDNAGWASLIYASLNGHTETAVAALIRGSQAAVLSPKPPKPQIPMTPIFSGSTSVWLLK